MFYMKSKDIQKSYGGRKVVKGINLEVKKNEILAVIGPNGAGKSTTLEMLIGLRSSDEGTIHYWQDSFKAHIGVQLQSVPFFPGLTALENLQLFAAFYKKVLSKTDTMKLLTRCGLQESGGTEASRLSGGQQKRLAIAAALVHNPELVFLDEPTAALDPRSRQEIHELIREIFQQEKTVVFTSHDMDEVRKLATRVIMIDGGMVIAEGEPIAICQQHQVDNLEDLYIKLTTKEEIVCGL